MVCKSVAKRFRFRDKFVPVRRVRHNFNDSRLAILQCRLHNEYVPSSNLDQQLVKNHDDHTSLFFDWRSDFCLLQAINNGHLLEEP